MPRELYFMGLGGLGLLLAGFTGLIAALDRRPTSKSPVTAWRIRNTVIGGFIVAFGGFGTVALHTVTGEDLALTVRLMSLFLAITNTFRLWREQRPGPAWPSERGRKLAIGAVGAMIVAYLVNVVIGRLGLLQVMFLAQLGDPAAIFLNTVLDVAHDDTEDTDTKE